MSDLSILTRAPRGARMGGPGRLPARTADDLGWWAGSRLVVRKGARGVLRFEAQVQRQNTVVFRRFGWRVVGIAILGIEHTTMRSPIDRIQRQIDAAKSALGGLLADLADPGSGGYGLGFSATTAHPCPART